MNLVLVNPHHVKKSKELDGNHPTKNDRKDSKTIAKLVVEGRYMEPYIPIGVYANLRVSVNNRWCITKELNGIKNRIERWLKIYFPEFSDTFGSTCGNGSMIVLHMAPLPEEVISLGPEGINHYWRKVKLRAVGMNQAKRLYTDGLKSVGRKDGSRMARMELMMLLDDYNRKNSQFEVLDEVIEELCMQIPEVEKVLEIKGVGMLTVAGFFAEVGDISRFDSPK